MVSKILSNVAMGFMSSNGFLKSSMYVIFQFSVLLWLTTILSIYNLHLYLFFYCFLFQLFIQLVLSIFKINIILKCVLVLKYYYWDCLFAIIVQRSIFNFVIFCIPSINSFQYSNHNIIKYFKSKRGKCYKQNSLLNWPYFIATFMIKMKK